jgi:hypothetical protein
MNDLGQRRGRAAETRNEISHAITYLIQYKGNKMRLVCRLLELWSFFFDVVARGTGWKTNGQKK